MLIKSIDRVINESFNQGQIHSDNIKNHLIKRIPFLKEYEIYDHSRDERRLKAQRIIFYKNVKKIIGDEIFTFPQYNVSSDVEYYPHEIDDNTFHNFIIKNRFHMMKPEGMDELTFRVITLANKQLEEQLSYYKEVVVPSQKGLSKAQFDEIINDMNGVLFRMENHAEKINIDLF